MSAATAGNLMLYERLLAAAQQAHDASALLDMSEEREDEIDGAYERILTAAVDADYALVRALVDVLRDCYGAGEPLLFGALDDLEAWTNGEFV